MNIKFGACIQGEGFDATSRQFYDILRNNGEMQVLSHPALSGDVPVKIEDRAEQDQYVVWVGGVPQQFSKREFYEHENQTRHVLEMVDSVKKQLSQWIMLKLNRAQSLGMDLGFVLVDPAKSLDQGYINTTGRLDIKN